MIKTHIQALKVIIFAVAICSLTSCGTSYNEEIPRDLTSDPANAEKHGETEDEFEVIKNHGMPPQMDVEQIIERSNMKEICDSIELDILDRDLMFMKCSNTPFEKYITLTPSNGSTSNFGELFPEKDLHQFWLSAREYLRHY
jgi:hypothetical protein